MLSGSVSCKRKPYMDIEENEEDKVEALETVELVESETTKTTKIGTTLSPEMRNRLVQFLKENLDVFA